MTTKQRAILTKGTIFVSLVVFILLLSRYGPQLFTVLRDPWKESDDLGKFFSSKGRITRFLVSLGPYSAAVFILLQALQVVVAPIPGELTGVVEGYIYGTAFGLLLSTVGLTLGSWVAFELARILGKAFVEKFVKKEVLEKFNFLTTSTGAAISFLLFLFPGFPKDYLCFVLGLTPMRLGTFLILSTLGRIPGTYLLTVQGASIRSHEYFAAIVIMFISAAILFIVYLHRTDLFHWIRSIRGKDLKMGRKRNVSLAQEARKDLPTDKETHQCPRRLKG